MVARYIGQNRKERIRYAVHTSMLLGIICGVFVLIVGISISKGILVWMNTPEDVLQQAVLYLRIFLLGAPFMMIYNFGSAVLRSVGILKDLFIP